MNPNNDETGKFASGSGGGTASGKSGGSKPWDPVTRTGGVGSTPEYQKFLRQIDSDGAHATLIANIQKENALRGLVTSAKQANAQRVSSVNHQTQAKAMTQKMQVSHAIKITQQNNISGKIAQLKSVTRKK